MTAEDDRLSKLESDVRILKDKDEIWRLISRYARAMDEEIDKELAAIFTDDVTFETKPWLHRNSLQCVCNTRARHLLAREQSTQKRTPASFLTN